MGTFLTRSGTQVDGGHFLLEWDTGGWGTF